MIYLSKYGKILWQVIIVLVAVDLVIILASPAHLQMQKMNTDKRAMKVLFDFTKDENAGNADWTINGAYSDWADNLTALGYTVEELTTNPITYGDNSNPQDLSNYAVYVIPEPQDSFTTNEANAIREFVLNGGGLILISDHNGADRNNNGLDAVHIFNENLSTAQYGITFNYDEVSKDPISDIDTTACPALTNNVSSIGIWNGATIKVSGNASGVIFYNSTAPVVVNSTFGNGRIIAIGDSSPFDDGTGESGDTLYDGWNEYSDAQLGINMVNWAANNTGNTSNAIVMKSQSGSEPSVSYGNGNYIVSYISGNYVEAYFVNSTTGEQSDPVELYKYGAGVQTAYYPEQKEFAVVSFDYSLPSYHSVLCRFVDNSTTGTATPHTVSDDANKSVAVAYGSGRILIVWINLTREQVEGVFYDGSYGENFTIAMGPVQKYSVAVGYDPQSSKFLVVWSENYDIHGRFVTTSGLGEFMNLTTAEMKESQLSVAGENGEFMITYRNGTFSSAKGAYFRIVSSEGNIGGENEISNAGANYCGAASVIATGDHFSIVYSDTGSGNADVYIANYSSSGSSISGYQVTYSTDAEETPVISESEESFLVVWNDHTSGTVEGRFYPATEVPELNPLIVVFLLVIIAIIVRKNQ